ncbi:MAG: hypothetical protein ACPGUV_06435 [Polyangiales bacterium]
MRPPRMKVEQETQERRGGALPVPQPRYGADGMLLPSDTRVAGLMLPRGLTVVRVQGREHVYESDVPVAALLRYFGTRLLTGEVQGIGEGKVYRRALPRAGAAKHPDGTPIYMDVRILPVGQGRMRVSITERPAAPQRRLDARTRRALFEQAERQSL